MKAKTHKQCKCGRIISNNKEKCKSCNITEYKAKTLKKKLEKADTIEEMLESFKKFKELHPEMTLQNNKPSIELIEKINFSKEQVDFIQHLGVNGQITIELWEKQCEIIERLNNIATRLNWIDEEDYD